MTWSKRGAITLQEKNGMIFQENVKPRTIMHENGFVPNCMLLSAKNKSYSSLDYHHDPQIFEQILKILIVVDNVSYDSD